MLKRPQTLALIALGATVLIIGLLALTGPVSFPESGGRHETIDAQNEPAPPPGVGRFVVSPGPGAPADWPARLDKLGIRTQAVGGRQWLVWVSPDRAAEVAALLDAELAPYDPAAHLMPGPDAGEDLVLTVTLFGEADKDRVAALVAENGGAVLRGLDEEGRVLRVRFPAAALDVLSGSPAVLYVEPYETPGFLNDRARAVTGADFPTVPGFVTAAGLTGAGQIVAVADSGLDRGRLDEIHPDLASVAGRMPKVPLLRSWAGGGTADPLGHGTHIAATVAGTGAASDGRYAGVAPGASVYFQALLNPQGELEPPADLTSLFRPAYEAGARVHVNGWGGRTNAYQSVSAQIDNFVHYYRDFLPVFGAGNTGPNARTLTPEANSKNALVVGASQNPRPAYGPDSLAASEAASFSSRGPAADGRVKPDLLAPGTAVVSARSGLIEGNFPANPAYTKMQGTSMAAAVAGGAATLLREYFKVEEQLARPSAALLRAALVNGARPAADAASGETFGVLDLGATVLSLREKSFLYADATAGLTTGGELSYQYHVPGSGAPFRATLTWTDPPAAPGAARTLVNNLDLVVTGPDGRVYLGNDFTGAGRPDDLNNTEQVAIPDPVPGTYTVTVRAADVAAHAVRNQAAPTQDFALVYGCPPVREIAAGGSGDTLETAGGGRIEVARGGVKNLVDGVPSPGSVAEVRPGADLYLFGPDPDRPRTVYAVSATWRAEAVRILELEQGTLLVEINPGDREGGFLLAPAALENVMINGRPGRVEDVPPGVEVTASVNPSTQTLWRVRAAYQERDGILAALDAAAGELRLVGEERFIPLSPTVAVAITDRIVNGCWTDLPFGAATTAEIGEIRPGMTVHLALSPTTGEVHYIDARRLIALGGLREVGEDVLTLETGKRFKVFPGATVRRNGEPAGLESLEPGDRILAVLLPGTHEVLSVEAVSHVLYGQVLYTGERAVYLLDQHNIFRSVGITSGTRFFRWGLQVDAAALTPGHWVRVILDPATGAAWRFDVAERAIASSGTVEGIDPASRALRIDGREYRFGTETAFFKNGYPVAADALRPGDPVEFTALPATATEEVVFTVAARADASLPVPDLTASALPFEGYLLVSGRTTAERVHFAREDGTLLEVPLREGGFAYPVARQPGENTLRVVAVDTRTGAVAGQQVSFPPVRETPAFSDIHGSWAERDILALAARNLMVGYPDGSFQPSRPVSRAEFSAVLVRLLGWPTKAGAAPDFTDAAAIPDWARASVAAAHTRELVSGYPDGTFRPAAPVTRTEAAAVLARALEQFRDLPGDTLPPYADWPRVPAWARESVSRAYEAGLFRGRADGAFAPDAPVTRAELAAALNRFLAASER